MTDATSTDDAFSYRSRRWPIAIDVTVVADDVRWCYRCFGDEWREQLPINVLVPYPTTTVSHSSVKLGVATLTLVPIASGVLLWWFGASPLVVALIVLIAFLAIAGTSVSHRRGPIEWVSFDTYYPDKSIYLFRNTGDLEFDAFIDRLRDAIIASGGSCGRECNPE